MGAWGDGPFDNDAAADIAELFDESGDDGWRVRWAPFATDCAADRLGNAGSAHGSAA